MSLSEAAGRIFALCLGSVCIWFAQRQVLHPRREQARTLAFLEGGRGLWRFYRPFRRFFESRLYVIVLLIGGVVGLLIGVAAIAIAILAPPQPR